MAFKLEWSEVEWGLIQTNLDILLYVRMREMWLRVQGESAAQVDILAPRPPHIFPMRKEVCRRISCEALWKVPNVHLQV